jgi:hypothetical protein
VPPLVPTIGSARAWHSPGEGLAPFAGRMSTRHRIALTFVFACGCASDPDDAAGTSDASSGPSSGGMSSPSSDGGDASVSSSEGEASSAGDDVTTSTTGADASTGDVPPLDGWCTRGDTALAIAAAELAPRSWGELPPNDSLAALEMAPSLLYWNDSGVWDPQARRLAWVGGPGTCCADPATYQHIAYDVESDAWSIDATPFVGSGHAYDGNALDPTTGLHYFAMFSDPAVKRFDGATWDTLPEVPWATQPAVGLTWFPELAGGAGGLVFVNGVGLTAWFDGAAWTEIAGAQDEPWGTYNMFAEHNPVHGQVWMGAGNDGDRINYVLDADLQLTRGQDAPVSLNNGNALHTVDPIGGNYLVKHEGEDVPITWWEYDAPADVWTEIVDMQGAPDFSETSEFQVPIPECGVILVFAHYFDDRHAYLYRHS